MLVATRCPILATLSENIKKEVGELIGLRALVPVQSDPLKIEVDFWPEYVGDPCPVVLLGFDEPFGIFD